MAKCYNYPSRTLEITVLSGEDLQLDRRSIKKNAYVVVRSESAESYRATEMDNGEGGSCPNWNERLVLDLPLHAQAVALEVHCKTAFGDRIVGSASVPVSDIAGGYVPDTFLHFLSYRLRDSRGQRNGVINISVRTKVAAPEYTCSASVSAPEKMTVGVPVGKGKCGDVVTGVPVWCAYVGNF